MKNTLFLTAVLALCLAAAPVWAGTIQVKVMTRGGSPASGIKVSTGTCSAGGTFLPDTRTNSNGVAAIDTQSHDKVCYLYINGTEYKGSYSAGNSYSFTMP